MVVNPSVPANTVPEFIAYAKANPGKINMAAPGIGSLQHVSGELFKMMTDVNMVSVPYRGGAPALADLLDGMTGNCAHAPAFQVRCARLPSKIGYRNEPWQ
jgi:tripartite-type tricarboxylate transporter receptor subunit TctC